MPNQSFFDELSSIGSSQSRMRIIIDRVKQILLDRNASYSPNSDATGRMFENIRSSERIGIPAETSCFLRMEDKWSRLEGLIKSRMNSAVDGERTIDTALDLGTYALILVCLLAEREIEANKIVQEAVHNGFLQEALKEAQEVLDPQFQQSPAGASAPSSTE